MNDSETQESLSNEGTVTSTYHEENEGIDTGNYSEWSKEELIEEIKKLKKRKKYGIVWEEKKEIVAEYCKIKLPVFTENKDQTILTGINEVNHFMIEGDNYHALSVLNYTNHGKVDIIYIDPPYNTGNNREWKFNDKYISSEDQYKHSKWLSFMSKRLYLAKNVLSDRGIIFISIDEHEFAQLKLLCDDIFGESNFITMFIRKKKSTSTNVKGVQVSALADYILCYRRTIEGKLNPRVFKKEDRTYKYRDEEGRYRTIIIEKKNSGGYRRESMIFKILGRYPREGKRWQIGEEKARELEKINRFVIEDGIVKLKIYEYEETDTSSAQPNILEDLGSTDSAQKELDKILGKKGVFENPKPVELIMHLISLSEKHKNSVILDFYAGSGTTGQAVLELNKLDGGRRTFILCTNNEDNNNTGEKIASDICYPRIRNNITGYKSPDGKIESGLGGNLRYFSTDFVDATETDANKKKLVDRSTEMLCLKENCFNLEFEEKEFRIYSGETERLLSIIYDDDGIDGCKIKLRDLNRKAVIYIFSLDDSNKEEDFADIADLIEIRPIPASIMNVYRRLFR